MKPFWVYIGMGLVGNVLPSRAVALPSKGSLLPAVSSLKYLSWIPSVQWWVVEEELRITCVLMCRCICLFQLLTVNPENNSLALVYRDRETLKFVKHINHRSLEQKKTFPNRTGFWDFSFVYYEWQGWTKLKGDPSSVLESPEELQGDLSDIVLKTVWLSLSRAHSDCPQSRP